MMFEFGLKVVKNWTCNTMRFIKPAKHVNWYCVEKVANLQTEQNCTKLSKMQDLPNYNAKQYWHHITDWQHLKAKYFQKEFTTGWYDDNCYLRTDFARQFVLDEKLVEFFGQLFGKVDFYDQIATMMMFDDCRVELVNRRPTHLICECDQPAEYTDLANCKCYCQTCKLSKPDHASFVWQPAIPGRECDLCHEPTYSHTLYDLDAGIDVCDKCAKTNQQFIEQHKLVSQPAKTLDMIGCPDFQCIFDWLLVARLPTHPLNNVCHLLVNANPDAKLFGRLGLVTCSRSQLAYWLLDKPTSEIVDWFQQFDRSNQSDQTDQSDQSGQASPAKQPKRLDIAGQLVEFCKLDIPEWLHFCT